MFADLHLHTRFSDGLFTPEELVAAARPHGFAALALTDHDTVDGCAPMARACAAACIEFMPGIELTAEQDGHELHILGYGLDTANRQLLAEAARFQAVRQKRVREMVARLNQLNIPLGADAVLAQANCRAPGRPHVARALIAAGVCGDSDEAFERFLKKGRPAWAPKFKMSAGEAIALLHKAGGAAVLAHPGLNRADALIPSLVNAGLDGIEGFHTKHSTVMAERYLELADRLGVLVTGGSDCHGPTRGKPLIGTVKLPYQRVEKLKARVAEIRRSAERAEADQSSIAHRPS